MKNVVNMWDNGLKSLPPIGLSRGLCPREGFPSRGIRSLGAMGSGPGQDQEFPCCRRVVMLSSCRPSPQKSSKIQNGNWWWIIPRKKWELLSTAYCTVFRRASFSEKHQNSCTFWKSDPRTSLPVLGQKFKTGVYKMTEMMKLWRIWI